VTWRLVVAAALVALVAGVGASAAPRPQGLKIRAPAAIVVDAATGQILWSKREHMRRPIASTTKIMTALVAMERLRPNDVVRVTREAARVPWGEGLKAGERVPAWKLFYGLLLSSANDTAVALAVAAGGTRERFLKFMNQKARALGLRHTQYRSASGLIDKGNYSTVYDLAMLTRHALRNPRFRSIVATKHRRVWWRKPTGAKLYENHNKLLWRYAGADGVKTGYTRASGPCLVASATRNGIQLITVVLDSPDHYGDTIHLLDYGFRHRG
jgi:serine-type D-Ala-D-Ala carboxypeptidase (penicillin-binding protein 5/6)